VTAGRTRPTAAATVSALVCVLAAACGQPSAATGTPPTTTPAPVATTAPGATTSSGPAVLRSGPGALSVYTVEPQPTPGSCHYRWDGADPLPDPACTPGAVDPQVTQADIDTTICHRGWTATIRPPEDVTSAEKRGSAEAYGYTGPFTTGEYDHLVPLELGGDPNDPANLWVEPNDHPGATSTSNGKDALENRLRELVCAGSLSLDTARLAIATNWVAAAAHYG